MSQDALFVIVEGKVADPYFAEKLCQSSTAILRVGYQVHMITQIKSPSGAYAGGKDAVLSYYEYCSRAGKLTQRNSSGQKRLAFIVDRDAQQLTGGMRRSRHVVYTYYADTEALVFSESNEAESLALAASLDKVTTNSLLTFLGDWRSLLADAWRPWIELCCLASAARSRTWVGFGKAQSLIHDGPLHRNLDTAKLAVAERAVEDTSLFTGAVFVSLRKSVLEKVHRVYQQGNGATLLKGKWLPAQLTLVVKQFFPDAGDWDEEGFRESVRRCYEANLSFDGPGARQMRDKLEALLQPHSS